MTMLTVVVLYFGGRMVDMLGLEHVGFWLIPSNHIMREGLCNLLEIKFHGFRYEFTDLADEGHVSSGLQNGSCGSAIQR